MNLTVRLTRSILAGLVLLALSACGGGGGGGGGSTPAPTITGVAISPTSANLTTSQQQQFNATVTGTGSFSSAVTWSASGTGSVTSAGLYTAPSTAGSYTVTVTSVQDPTKSASAAVTVTSPIASSLTYIDPPSGTYKLVRDASSTATHLVLNLVGPASTQLSGVGFYLSADQTKVTWANVGTDKVASAAFSNTLQKTKVAGDVLQAGIYQKGTAAAVTTGASTVLAQVALNLKASVAPGGVTFTAPAGKAVIMNPPANPVVNTAITISLGTLTAN